MIQLSRYLLAAFALAAGEACGYALVRFSPIWPGITVISAVMLVFGYAFSWRWWKTAAFFLLGLVLMFRYFDSRNRFLRENFQGHGRFETSFTVEDAPRIPTPSSGKEPWISFPSSVSGIAVRVIFQQEPGSVPPAPGEVWRCSGWMQGGNAADITRRPFWIRGEGTFARREQEALSNSWRTHASALRKELARRIGIGLEHRSDLAALNRAILLGNRTGLTSETRSVFANAGTTHIFSVSGLHVVVIAGVLRILLALLFVPARLCSLILIPILWTYILTIGSPPSAVRAGAMASLHFLAPLVWRRPDGLVAWTITFIAVHILAPEMLLNTGSLLSFSVMLGILLFLKWGEPLGNRNMPTSAFGVSFAAWAAGAPIVAYTFGTITPGALLANILLMPAATLSVSAGALGVLASCISNTLAAHINNAAALCTDAMVGVSWAVSRLPGSNFPSGQWRLWECAAWYALIILAFWLVRSIVLRRRSAL